MCEPTTLAALALTAGGGLITGLSNQEAQKKQAQLNNQAAAASMAARRAEQARQKGFEQDASNVWTQNLEKVAPDQQIEDQTTAADNLLSQFDAYKATDPTGGQFLSGQVTPQGDTQIVEQNARTVAKGAQEARDRIAALFSLTGASTAGANAKQAFGATNDILSTNANLRRGSLSASQLEQSIPGGTYTPGMGSTIGAIMTGVGSAIPGMGGMSAAPGFMGKSPLIPIAQRNGN